MPVYFEVSPELFDTIITDEEWLWQMLLNLLTNACKYTQKGRIDVKLSLLRDQAVQPERPQVDTATQRLNVPRLEMQTQSESTDMLLCEVIDTGESFANALLFLAAVHHHFQVNCSNTLLLFFFFVCFCRGWNQSGKDWTCLRRLRAGAGGPGDRHGAGAVRRAHPR